MHDGLLRAGCRVRRLFALAALGGLLVGCSEASSSADDVASNQRSIVYGQVSGPEDDAVVQTVAKDSGVIYRCTGTLVAPNLVITARHCVSNFVELEFACTSGGELTPDSKGGTMGALYDPSAISIRIGQGPNPAFGANALRLFAIDTPSICRNDIALIMLDRMLDLPIKPMRLFKGTGRSEGLRVLGYGLDETGMIFGVRHVRDDLVVSEVGPSEFNSAPDSIPPRTLLTEGPALCIGDSGGPALVASDAIAAVWSQVVGDCKASGARNVFTEIAPFTNSLVLPAFEAAGAEPWLEGNSGPGLTTGGTVGTGGGGGAGNAGGDSSTGGDTSTEGGTPGIGGTADTGGSVSTGGLVGTGGDDPAAGAPPFGGSDGNGGRGANGGSATSGASGTDGGLRKKGGCTCGVVGAPSGGGELMLVPLAALALLRRRRAQ